MEIYSVFIGQIQKGNVKIPMIEAYLVHANLVGILASKEGEQGEVLLMLFGMIWTFWIFWSDWMEVGEFQSINNWSLMCSQRILLDISPSTHNGLFLRHLWTGQRIHRPQEKRIKFTVLSFSNPLHAELKQPWIVAGRCPINKAERPIFLP